MTKTKKLLSVHCQATLPSGVWQEYINYMVPSFMSVSRVVMHQVHRPTNLSEWVSTGTLPDIHYSGGSIKTSSQIYLIGGGTCKDSSSRVYRTNINPDGTLSEWWGCVSFPVRINDSAVVVLDKRVYLLGGTINEVPSDKVYTSYLDQNGYLGDWSEGDPLPIHITSAKAITTDTHVYLIGGWVNGEGSSRVFSAKILHDGELGPWVTQRHLPESLSASASCLVGNKIYLFGGIYDEKDSNKVLTAEITEDGTLGEWYVSDVLPSPVHYHQCLKIRGRVYVVGGYKSSDVYSTKVDEHNNLGLWTKEPSLPSPVFWGHAEHTDTHIHLLGGIVKSKGTKQVYTCTIKDSI